MLYWPQVHWLKLMAVMVGSINQVSRRASPLERQVLSLTRFLIYFFHFFVFRFSSSNLS
jgi:hypothetical protein